MITPTVVVFTRDEVENLPELLQRLGAAAPDAAVIVVDDNPSGKTSHPACQQGRTVCHYPSDRKLSPGMAVISAAGSGKVIVMNGDLQHPPELVPAMLRELDTHGIVVASRYCKGGRIEGRTLRSKLAASLANLLALPLAPRIKDRTSGYFGFRRSIVPDTMKLSSRGYNMLEVLVRGQPRGVAELPLTLTDRRPAESGFSFKQVKDCLLQLAQLYAAKFKWIKFGIVGSTGAVLKLTLMYLFTDILGMHYMASYLISFFIVITHNYAWNSRWTFQQRGMPAGLGKYAAVSALAAVLKGGILYLLTEAMGLWYMFSTAIAILVTFSASYLLSRRWVWFQKHYDVRSKT